MTRQQILAIRMASVVGGVFLSLAVPSIMLGAEVKSELAWRILAPGFGVVPVVHNVLAAIISTVIIDAFIYSIAAFIAASLFLGIYQRSHEALN